MKQSILQIFSMMPLSGHEGSSSRTFTFFVLGTSICHLFYFQFSGSNLSLTLIQFQNWKVHFLYLVRFPLCQYFIIGKICVSYITAVLPVSLYLVHNGVGNSSNLSESFLMSRTLLSPFDLLGVRYHSSKNMLHPPSKQKIWFIMSPCLVFDF